MVFKSSCFRYNTRIESNHLRCSQSAMPGLRRCFARPSGGRCCLAAVSLHRTAKLLVLSYLIIIHKILTKFTTGFPVGNPTGLSEEFPAGFPTGFSTGIPTQYIMQDYLHNFQQDSYRIFYSISYRIFCRIFSYGTPAGGKKKVKN